MFFDSFLSVNLTNHPKISINTIDFFAKVCYTEIKLENKTNILTNKTKTKTKKQKKGNKMAEILKLPKQVVDSEWRDDIDTDFAKVDYAIYGGNEQKEREFISPDKISKESLAKIKQRNQKIGSLFTGRFDKFAA